MAGRRRMTAPMLRFAVSVASMAVALAAFMLIRNPWAMLAAVAAAMLLGAIIGQAIYRRFADAETKRRDLEDRVRNESL